MNDFLTSLKSDLLDRRFLPVLAVLAAALLGVLAYTLLGGSSSSSTPPAPSASAGTAGRTGTVAITQAPAPNDAVAETTSGAHSQHGAPRNPFTPLPGAQSQSKPSSSSSSSRATQTASGGSSSGATHTPGSGGGSGAGGGSTGTPSSGGGSHPSTPTTPPRHRLFIHFHVTAQFGPVPPTPAGAPAGTPPPPAQLRTYSDIALDEPLPDKTNPQVIYLGVVLRTGREAVFALAGEAILHGSGVCKPSPTQCQAIVLRAGQSERLDTFEPNGQPVTYELKLVSIATNVGGSASAARAHAARAGRALLGHDGVPTLADLHLAARRGGLVPVWHPAFGAHAAHRG